jgi:hypothetical protein
VPLKLQSVFNCDKVRENYGSHRKMCKAAAC